MYGSGNANRNVYGSNLLMRTVGEDSYYYMYNGHADVTALINVATGKVDATYYYDAFGNILESTGNVDNNITYAGYQYDEETGLYYLNARMYDPKIARFLQEDTYTGTPDDPLSLNLYTYVKNNPLIYYDPTGHLESKISLWVYEEVKRKETQQAIAETERLKRTRVGFDIIEFQKELQRIKMYCMLDQLKAGVMDTVTMVDWMISSSMELPIRLRIMEYATKKYFPNLVNESSFEEEIINSILNNYEYSEEYTIYQLREIQKARLEGYTVARIGQLVVEFALSEVLLPSVFGRMGVSLSDDAAKATNKMAGMIDNVADDAVKISNKSAGLIDNAADDVLKGRNKGMNRLAKVGEGEGT
nr:RHS repeat-associated core domain-containing protein [Acetivibrio straminisolvens]